MADPSTAISRIEGTLTERTTAFGQIAANFAASGLAPPGFNTVPKIIAACWGADALGVHPVNYMLGVHAYEIDGRVTITAKWEFEHALLKSRLPGYKFKVVESTEEKCVLWGTDGADEHTVTYTMADAKRQGLTEKKGRQYDRNSVEMLFKQAYHRLARLVGAPVLMGLPAYEFDDGDGESPSRPPVEPSGAEVVGQEKDDDPKPAGTPTELLQPHLLLSKAIDRAYGKQAWAVKLEKCGILYTEILQAGAPDGVVVQPVVFKRADQIGPVEAKQILDYINEKWPAGASAGAAAPAAKEDPARAGARESGASTTAPVVDGGAAVAPQPGPEATAQPEGPALEPIEQPDAIPDLSSWEGFAQVVSLARQKDPRRSFVREDPPKSGKFHLIDGKAARDLGYNGAVLLYDNHRVVDPGQLMRIGQWIIRDTGCLTPTLALERHENRS